MNPLLKKLLVKPGHTLRLANAPRNAMSILGPVPEDVTVTEHPGEAFHAVLLFARDSGELQAVLRGLASELKPGAIVWAAYPKKASGLETDLGQMNPWQGVAVYGLAPVASIAIDADWTALRLKPLAEVKPSGLGADEVKNSPYARYVDVERRTVTSPPDLAAAFAQHPAAEAFFSGLSFTNKKEYALWLLTAKQEKTRLDRLEKSIEKLLAGKKNPSEK